MLSCKMGKYWKYVCVCRGNHVNNAIVVHSYSYSYSHSYSHSYRVIVIARYSVAKSVDNVCFADVYARIAIVNASKNIPLTLACRWKV